MSLLPERWRKSRRSSSQGQVFFFLSPSLRAFLLASNACRLELQLRLIQDPAVAFSVVVSISGDDHSTLIVWKFNKGKDRVGGKKKWRFVKVFERQWLVAGVSLPDLPWSAPSVCEESSRPLGPSLLITWTARSWRVFSGAGTPQNAVHAPMEGAAIRGKSGVFFP